MNKEIHQLWVQASLDKNIQDSHELIQKFAELVVQQCAEFVEQDQGSGKELFDRLKKHFELK